MSYKLHNVGSHLHIVELSNELLHSEIPCLKDVEDLGLIKIAISETGMTCEFHCDPFEDYFAATFLINQPLMHVHKFAAILQSLKMENFRVLLWTS